MSEKLTWTWESAWNTDPNNGYAGGGNRCASWFSRPTWQTHVSSAATCSCRAEPDISADGDPETGARVYTNNGSAGTVGGTSLASPLAAGMAVLTDAYLAKQGHKRTGWAAPEIYKLGNTASMYNTYFHDVRCGFNGSPAQVGWDQASGFGSIDWYNFARAAAGKFVAPVKRTFAYCTQIAKIKQLFLPWNAYLTWPVFSQHEKVTYETAAWDNSGADPMKGFHSASYVSKGVLGSVFQTDVFDLTGDGSFTKKGTVDYLASFTKTTLKRQRSCQTYFTSSEWRKQPVPIASAITVIPTRNPLSRGAN